MQPTFAAGPGPDRQGPTVKACSNAPAAPTPPGPVPDIDGNWLYMGSNISGWDGGTFETVHTWESSPEGDTWDTDIYSDKN